MKSSPPFPPPPPPTPPITLIAVPQGGLDFRLHDLAIIPAHIPHAPIAVDHNRQAIVAPPETAHHPPESGLMRKSGCKSGKAWGER
jgi:hypothetical protein